MQSSHGQYSLGNVARPGNPACSGGRKAAKDCSQEGASAVTAVLASSASGQRCASTHLASCIYALPRWRGHAENDVKSQRVPSLTRGMVILVWRPGGETNAQGHCYVVAQTYLTEKNQTKCCSHLHRALFTPFFFWQHPEGRSQPLEPPAPPSAPRGQSLPA